MSCNSKEAGVGHGKGKWNNFSWIAEKFRIILCLPATNMRHLNQRWYIPLIFIPIVINLFTNTITWDILKNNLTITWLIISIILNIIIVGEFLLYYTSQKRESQNLNNDKKIFSALIIKLNLDKNEYPLKSANHNERFDYAYVENFKNFISETNKLQNHISNKFLSEKLSNFKQALNDYLDVMAIYMVSNFEDNFHTISVPYSLKYKNPKLYESHLKQLDDKANSAYAKLKELIISLRNKNVI
ncbi:MAG TPA: hypothetical protein VIJ75_16105 [Hanamia sp.]